MPPAPQQQTGIKEIDFGHYVRHYASLLWRWKWWMLTATPLALGGAFIVFLKLSDATPELSATALIGMEPIAGMIDVEERMQQTPEITSQTQLISSRNFLQNTVNTLSLRLRVAGTVRSAVFDSVFVDSAAQPGKYAFIIDKSNNEIYTVLRKKNLFGKEPITRGKLADLNSLTLPGVFLGFNRAFLTDPQDFSFSIIDTRTAVEMLYNNLSIGTPNVRERNPSFSISVKGKDYASITTIANTIADQYVEKNLSLRQARNRSVMAILEKQLAKAKAELELSESQLRAFQSANPTVGLALTTQQTVNDLSELERGSSTTASDLATARELQQKLVKSSKKDVFSTTREVLLFLNARGNTTAPVLDAEITRLLEERRGLQNSYDANHPKLVENLSAINAIVSKTILEIFNYIRSTETAQTERKAGISALSGKMRVLPAKELRLAKLTRQQQVHADIYARILDKYNQSKVSDVVEVSDVYVMDYAVAPIPPPPDPKKLLGICLAICLGTIFGPVIAADFLTRTVRTEQELRARLPYMVLESIPPIASKSKQWNPKGTKGRKPSDFESKLIINEFKGDQEYIKELFRSLRTKILHLLQDSPDKSLIVTSLDAGAGKSTICSNIGIALAQQNRKTIIIDGDLRLGTIHQFFKMEKNPGLSEFLASDLPITDEFVTPIIRSTEIPNLFVIPSGRYAVNAAELISSERFSRLKSMLSQKFEFLLCDSPPVGVSADGVSISNCFSQYLIVIKAGKTNVYDLKKKIKEYSALQTQLIGLVLNHAAIDSKLNYYKYSKYY
ncbi:MAG: polysaccharide biosynthesis tyrosine autokinase [Chitinispirillaceae bacterium]|nr:polysaccharide biosynthesis tyrosine autokinase [Chitinispirillaceae bacterium]